MAGMQDLPSPLQVVSLAGGEHSGRQGRCTLGGGEHCGEDIDRGEKAGEDCREGEPRWECTLWGELCPPVCMFVTRYSCDLRSRGLEGP